MPKNPRVQVINLQSDLNREEFVRRYYGDADLSHDIIAAVNGHSPVDLVPYQALIASHFWGKDLVKPGALGCFFSHYKAWEKLLASGQDFMIIAEDDSQPDPQFVEKWPDYEKALERADILFLNDRLARWAHAEFDDVNHALKADKKSGQISEAQARAPGADGYVIKRKLAAYLIDLTKKLGTICGVDWFILGALCDENLHYWPSGFEFDFIRENFADEAKDFTALIAQKPLFELERGLPSAIKHNHKTDIRALKAELRILS